MTDRAEARALLLQRAGWADATVAFLAGDASDRRYDRLTGPRGTAVLMDAPPPAVPRPVPRPVPEKVTAAPALVDDPATFLAVAAHLNAIGLSAPRLIDADLAAGFLLIEDLGDGLFARVVARQPAMEQPLYAVACAALLQLQAAPPMPGLPDLTAADWAKAAILVFSAYAPATGAPPADAAVAAVENEMCHLIGSVAATAPKIMILRDFHAENLIWLPDRHGAARAGLLDFQLAQMGHPVYDLVSLVQDARRDVAPATRQALIRQFCDGAGLTQADCDRALAIWGAQRALRILGVFARLAGVQGKTGYLSLLPRVWGHLQHNLLHPDLAALRRLVDAHLPAPDAGLQARLAAPSAAPSAARSGALA